MRGKKSKQSMAIEIIMEQKDVFKPGHIQDVFITRCLMAGIENARPTADINNALMYLFRKGKISKVSRGRWLVPTKQAEVADGVNIQAQH